MCAEYDTVEDALQAGIENGGELPVAEVSMEDQLAALQSELDSARAIVDDGEVRAQKARDDEDALKAMVTWANGPVELLQHDPTKGVERFAKGEGHRPWSPEQLAFAEQTFTGMLRRFYFLSRYTGQRISDVVRLNPNDEDEGGFSLPQKKTGVRPWCPIFPELEAEMATWERRPGPYLLQEEGKSTGKPFSPNQMWKAFDRERRKHAILDGAVPHGLRANAVIRLRGAGYSALQISDMVGMSVEMVEHYCRHADRKASGQAVLRELQERNADEIVKPLKNGKQK